MNFGNKLHTNHSFVTILHQVFSKNKKKYLQCMYHRTIVHTIVFYGMYISDKAHTIPIQYC